jgi:nucleoside-triphosphatase THEP1
MFDAQCDFAAIAYEMDDDPDGLLLRFAEDLRQSGHRVVGLVQHRIHRSRSSNLNAFVLPAAQLVTLGEDIVVDDARGCRIDDERLAAVASVIAGAIEKGGDLVIVNRFGELEAAGRGLIRLIEQAVDADIPVITAVPVHRFADWVRYSNGMSVRLPCRRAALDAWWRSVSGGIKKDAGGTSFCALVK